ncbi:muts domain V-domain-containing protein [Dimargaris cristalligena]|uniref:Muts domain V-domain-containing protein n=1 Tax=Dimargaris cristalligena TaxID=215637 RepID=A0A4P9ZSZ5_9FUNG|nr:muts domain V-domain-containing protein [Dimargaris cristalligena]|eukprot:RKP36694.1 muts domain V-domain-containing protein [Dimargaris cristalligena]
MNHPLGVNRLPGKLTLTDWIGLRKFLTGLIKAEGILRGSGCNTSVAQKFFDIPLISLREVLSSITSIYLDDLRVRYENLSKFLFQTENQLYFKADILRDRETEIIQDLTGLVHEHLGDIRRVGLAVGYLDCIMALAEVASKLNYSRPKFLKERRFELHDSRHPILDSYTDLCMPNNIELAEEQKLLLLIAPNSSGKSILMEQVCLIAVMAQIGSPATHFHGGEVVTELSEGGDIMAPYNDRVKWMTMDVLVNDDQMDDVRSGWAE